MSLAGVVLALALTFPAAQPPAAPAESAATGPAPSGATPDATQATGTNAWLTIYSVLPDRVADFEQLTRELRRMLAASADPVRKAQARELRIHRSSLPNAEGRLMYFVQLSAWPADAERTGLDALIELVGGDRATMLREQLAATLDPRNPSGSTYLIDVR